MGEVEALLQGTLVAEALMNAPVAVSLFDQEHRYVAVNDVFCTLSGYTREELTSRLHARVELAPDAEAGEAVAAAFSRQGQVAPQLAHATEPKLSFQNESLSTKPFPATGWLGDYQALAASATSGYALWNDATAKGHLEIVARRFRARP